jgi:hypothetical protein
MRITHGHASDPIVAGNISRRKWLRAGDQYVFLRRVLIVAAPSRVG